MCFVLGFIYIYIFIYVCESTVTLSVLDMFSEIPLFHVLTAKITFGNIFAGDTPVEGVSNLDEAGNSCCTIDENCFEAPANYSRLG